MNENNADNPGRSLAIASLVLGIIGLCTGEVFGIGAILGILAVVCGVMSGNKSAAAGCAKSGMATAGLVLGIIGIVFGAGCLICTVCGSAYDLFN